MSRQQILDDTIEYVQAHGLGELSLRQLAEAIGTSHRMILYHFHSRAHLLAAVVNEVEARERAATEAALADVASENEALRRAWNRLSRPARAGEERLFFELAAMAAHRRDGTESFADGFVAPWMEVAAAAGADPVQMRVDVAVMRGLLLDLLVTGDRSGATRAFERWLDQRDPRAARAPAPTGEGQRPRSSS